MCPTAFVLRTTLRGQKPGYLCGAEQLLEFAVSYALTPISRGVGVMTTNASRLKAQG